MKKFLPLVALAWCGWVSLAAEIPERFSAAVRRAMDADAEWVMTKKLASAQLELESSGQVSCCAGRGIVWQTQEPLMSQIRMTTNSMEFVHEHYTEVKPLKQLQHYGQLRKMVDDFVAGDAKAFDREFSFEWSSAPNGGWKMAVTPQRSQIAKFLRRAELFGSETLERVELSYASGDEVRLKFKELSGSKHRLWEDEKPAAGTGVRVGEVSP